MLKDARSSIYAFVSIGCCFGTLLTLPTAGQTPLAPPVSGDAARSAARQIAALRQEWVQNLRGKQLDQSSALYSSEAVFYSPDHPRTAGLPAIRALFATVMKTYDSDMQLNSTGLAVAGDLAVDSGDYDETITVRATGVKKVIRGSYLMALQRSKDQPWRITRQMWTQTLPAAP